MCKEYSLQDCLAALDALQASRFENRMETKRNFEVLYKAFGQFKKQSGVKNLAEYLDLMIKIMDYCQSPQFANFFKAFDKKLTKNVLKRCVIDPFTERIMKKSIPPDQKDEIEILAQDPQVINHINENVSELWRLETTFSIFSVRGCSVLFYLFISYINRRC